MHLHTPHTPITPFYGKTEKRGKGTTSEKSFVKLFLKGGELK
jgi:hypothetical protein